MNVPKPLLTKRQTFVGSYIEWLWLAKWMLNVFKRNLLALTASPDSWECFAPLALPGQGLGSSQLWLPRPRPSLTTPRVGAQPQSHPYMSINVILNIHLHFQIIACNRIESFSWHRTMPHHHHRLHCHHKFWLLNLQIDCIGCSSPLSAVVKDFPCDGGNFGDRSWNHLRVSHDSWGRIGIHSLCQNSKVAVSNGPTPPRVLMKLPGQAAKKR